MNVLLLSGVLIGLFGAVRGDAGYGSATLPGDLQDQTYPCSTCGDCGDCDGGDSCDEPCGRSCGRGACGDRTACGPLTFIFSIFKANTWCGPSCGERYWGDFYSDPPECHDPCDTCGNYVDRSSYRGGDWGSVGGYSTGGGGGCKNCNKNRVFDDEPIPEQGRVTYPSTRVSHHSTPAKSTNRTVRPTNYTR
jgi:hypothetical protein